MNRLVFACLTKDADHRPDIEEIVAMIPRQFRSGQPTTQTETFGFIRSLRKNKGPVRRLSIR
jgi:hypothetical protein